MTINLADNNPRISYSVAQGTTQQTFAVPFEFFNDSDLSVYVDGVLKAEGTHYTITGGDGSTGNVVFVTATPPAVQQVLGATGGSTVVITRTTPIERTSDFSAGADINRAALNEQLDILTAMVADAKDRLDRSVSLNGYDAGVTLTLPVNRAGKVIAFDASGNLINGPTVSSVDTVSNASADIQLIADNIDEILDADDQAAAAASSASAAASSASAASGSATAAAASASTASASADAALAALDSFDDRYLGQKASDPTLDNDGNALTAGALYFNTTDDVMKVYEGSIWVAAYASLSGALVAANNLSDLASASAALTNLGLTASATELNQLDSNTFTSPLSIPDGTAAAPALTNTGDTNTGLYFPAADTVAVSTAGTERLRITSDGLVGIGGASSGPKLAVIAAANSSSLVLTDATQSTLTIKHEATNLLTYETGGVAVQRWVLNGTERMRIDSSGNVGIGVTPSAWQTSSAIQMAGGQGYSRFGITNNSYYDGAAYRYVSTAAATLYGNNSGSHLWFNAPSGTAGNAITFTQAMTLDASGNLGLGTISPSTNLHVNQTGATAGEYGIRVGQAGFTGNFGAFNIDTTGARVMLESSAAYPIAFDVNGSERLRIGSAGQIGIGGANYGTAGQVLTSGGSGAAPSWADVGTAIAGQTAGAVGTYMFARSSLAGDTAFGSTRAGSDLFPTSAIYAVTGAAANVTLSSGTVQSGTWRAMGYYDISTANGTSGSSFGATLWLRIS